MHYILFALTLLSFFGCMLFVHRSPLRVLPDCLPAATASLLVCLLFFAACLSIWAPCVLLIQVFGVGYSVYGAFLFLRTLRAKQKICIPPAVVFFALATVACVLCLRNNSFWNTDVYSHWARIVKEMLSFQGFATPESTIVYNRDYPTGAALFITYFLQATGYSDSLAIICQGILVCALYSTVFIGASWCKPASLLLRLGAIALTLGGFTSTFHDLMIDYVVAVSGAAALIAIAHTWQRKETQSASNLIWLMSLACLPSMLKSGGIIFSVMSIVLLLILYAKPRHLTLRELDYRHTALHTGLLCSPFIISFLWNSYVTHAWRDTGMPNAKFALNLTSMQATLAEKSVEMQHAVVLDSLRAMLIEANNRYLFVPLVLMLLVMHYKKSSVQQLRTPLWIGLSAWLLYHVGYIFMMLFLMPENEVAWSTTLGYTRYVGTITIAVSIWWFWLLLEQCKELSFYKRERRALLTVGATVLLSCVVLQGSYINTAFVRQELDQFQLDRQHLNTVAATIAPFYTRDDMLLIYSGDSVYDTSAYNNDTYATIFLTLNTTSMSNTYIEGSTLETAPTQLEQAFHHATFFVIANSSDELANLLTAQDIGYDALDGTLYSVQTTEKGVISLEKML